MISRRAPLRAAPTSGRRGRLREAVRAESRPRPLLQHLPRGDDRILQRGARGLARWLRRAGAAGARTVGARSGQRLPERALDLGAEKRFLSLDVGLGPAQAVALRAVELGHHA